MVVGDAGGDGLQHRGLAGLGRSDDQRALAEAERGDQVDQAAGHVTLPARRLGALELEHAARVHRGKPVEVGPAPGLLRRASVDRGDLAEQRRLAAIGARELHPRVRRPSAGRTRARCVRPRARRRAAGPTPCFAGAGNPGAHRVRGRRGFRVLSYAQGLSSSVWDAAAPEGRRSGAAERTRNAARRRRRRAVVGFGIELRDVRLQPAGERLVLVGDRGIVEADAVAADLVLTPVARAAGCRDCRCRSAASR